MIVRILEDRSRRYNLRFYGIEQWEEESWAETEQNLKNTLSDILGIQNVKIERAHRVGDKKRSPCRTIVAKLSSFKIKKCFNDKLQQIDSPYFSVENLIAISEQLIKDNFSILHLNIRSLNVNIDNFRGFSGSLNGNFNVIVLTESCCDKTTNENSLLSLDSSYSVHKTRKNIKGGGICIYIHKQLEFKLRNNIDIFNNEIETCSV